MSFLAFSIAAVVANIVVPKPANPINPTNPFNPVYPFNNTYPTFYTDYTDYDDLDKIFKYKNNRMSVTDNIRNSLRSLYYPFEKKIPLYAHVYIYNDIYNDIYKDNNSR